jgi:hypothetical protein
MTINSPDSLPDDELQDGSKGSTGKNDGSIPGGADGVGIGADGEANTFEPEEDPDATNSPETD